jgi:hypothetical protein
MQCTQENCIRVITGKCCYSILNTEEYSKQQ